MKNVLRSLVFDGQVSLTLADTTQIVGEGLRLHKLSPASAYVFGKALSALTFMSACLKEEQGEISLALQCEGEAGTLGVSGNRALRIRGYIGNPSMEGAPDQKTERRALGQGSFTIVRDDGYNRPFVGSCALNEGGMDASTEEYYRISEQLPTRICTEVCLDERGRCTFAGVIALQPLPFASEEVLKRVATLALREPLTAMQSAEPAIVAAQYFQGEIGEVELRQAEYKCNCSREYLTRVLVTLGEAQLRDIIRTEGAVRVHCHYCNKDYEFTAEDADGLFPKEI